MCPNAAASLNSWGSPREKHRWSDSGGASGDGTLVPSAQTGPSMAPPVCQRAAAGMLGSLRLCTLLSLSLRGDVQRESQWPRWGHRHGLGCPVAGMSQSLSGRCPGYTQTPASRGEVGTGWSIVVTAAKSGEIKKKKKNRQDNRRKRNVFQTADVPTVHGLGPNRFSQKIKVSHKLLTVTLVKQRDQER